MFESPFINEFDSHHKSTYTRTKDLFKVRESSELRSITKHKSATPNSSDINGSGDSLTPANQEIFLDEDIEEDEPLDEDLELEYIEKQVLEGDENGKAKQIEYIGLMSQSVYNEQGEITSNVYAKAMAEKGFTYHPTRGPMRQTIVFDRKTRRVGFTPERNYNIYNAGLELLPRNTCRPRVSVDCAKTQELYNRKLETLSPSIRKVLKRTNYRLPYSLSYCKYDDDWLLKGLRPRSAQVMANILYVTINRGDYERAWEAMTSLIREPCVDVRSVWLIALELLSWKEKMNQTGDEPFDERFLDWIIINFPSKHLRHYRWGNLPRAADAVPFLAMAKLARGAVNEALDHMEDAVTQVPFSSDPLCWALGGVASFHCEKGDSRRRARTVKYFKRCEELGGLVPQFLGQVLSGQADNSDREDDASDASSDSSMN